MGNRFGGSVGLAAAAAICLPALSGCGSSGSTTSTVAPELVARPFPVGVVRSAFRQHGIVLDATTPTADEDDFIFFGPHVQPLLVVLVFASAEAARTDVFVDPPVSRKGVRWRIGNIVLFVARSASASLRSRVADALRTIRDR